jgi:CO/xanthine dehydrogenase Mo-binding subunit
MSATVIRPWTDPTKVIGKRVSRIDGHDRVTGAALYAADIHLPDMLYTAVLRCPYPHAIVRSIDLKRIMSQPGIAAVISAMTPEAEIPVPYPWWVPEGPPMKLFDNHCRHEGEEILAVAAETPYQAFDALRDVEVEYEQLPFVVDVEQGLNPTAPKVHDSGNLSRPVKIYERGNIEQGFAEADVVLENTFRTSAEIHTPIEGHVSVAQWQGNLLTVWTTTQAIFNEQQQISKALNLPLSAVRVISHYVGGSFGCKAELSKNTLIAALLARKTRRPVKFAVTREDSFLCVGNRPPNVMSLKAAATKDGTLTAFSLKNLGAVGAYADWADVGGPVTGMYRCPNVRVEETEVFINAGKARAFRGPGDVQGLWALEQMMDELAEPIGLDPIAFRMKNLISASQRSGKPYTSDGLAECLTQGAKAFGWTEKRARRQSQSHIKRGVGMAACRWSTEGGPPTTVIVSLLADGSVKLNMAAADQGTGTKTVMGMIIAEELSVPLDKIQIEQGDTATTQYGKPGGGSHSVVVYAPAVHIAALEVKRQLLRIASAELKIPENKLSLDGGRIIAIDSHSVSVPYEKLKGMQEAQTLVGVGQPPPDPDGIIMSFAAQFAEVEVNTKTGEIRVLNIVGANDSGRVMNRLTAENQVLGGMVMGLGFALTEKRIIDQRTGRMVNANWHDYKIPTANDAPLDQSCFPVETDDTECNNVGVKGLGELGVLATAPTIANAIYHATGVRVTNSPVTPMDMLRLLSQRKKRS